MPVTRPASLYCTILGDNTRLLTLIFLRYFTKLSVKVTAYTNGTINQCHNKNISDTKPLLSAYLLRNEPEFGYWLNYFHGLLQT